MNLLAFALTLLYWVDPSAERDLADAAMKHWESASQGRLRIQRTSDIKRADLRFRWVKPRARGLYGSAYASEANGKIVHELVINPALAENESDPLMAVTILFLTCVHESGHALGLQHTKDFADIMYSFEYGGDLREYFARYRRKLQRREDVQSHSPIAKGDETQLLSVLEKQIEKRSGGSAPNLPR